MTFYFDRASLTFIECKSSDEESTRFGSFTENIPGITDTIMAERNEVRDVEHGF